MTRTTLDQCRGAVAGLRRGGGVALVLAIGLLAASPASWAGGEIAADEALARARDGGMVILDVRTVGEWRQTGVPEDAAPVSLFPEWGVTNDDFVADVVAAVGGDRSTPIATICARGNRSALARDLLAKNGFTAVYSIAEGMLGSSAGPGWLPRGLPVEPCESC